ncbi:hypothetical protein B0T17DRAFT_174626 [Bombardia bombarda]|uniref:IBR domain-containing protein n=1 Tax=Bombardia bombarda TaxID=252184 RepID=A0AA39X8T2_9PEZI|nr:hypothetical protein B0T17DRAFT_174626 [Bombardia bombarda]
MVYNACRLTAVVSSITGDSWLNNIESPTWISCPISDCSDTLPIQNTQEMLKFLSDLKDPQIYEHINRFHIITRLRSAARQHSLPDVALRRAADLHTRLIDHGRMGFSLDSTDPQPEEVAILPLDTTDGPDALQIPFLTDMFLRTGQPPITNSSANLRPERRRTHTDTVAARLVAAEPRECLACTENLPEVVDDTLEDEFEWLQAIGDFSGSWALRIRTFPPMCTLPDCSEAHHLDLCRNCLDRSLRASLEARGPGGCDSLACPQGCGHTYSKQEVLFLATSTETRALYEKFRRLARIATLPNFRWCLAPGCGMGEVFDNDKKIPTLTRVSCSTCRAETCFSCQVP